MPSLAKAHIAVIAALATAVLVVAASRWNLENLGHFVLFLRAGDGGRPAVAAFEKARHFRRRNVGT
jgi:hypothetical protein